MSYSRTFQLSNRQPIFRTNINVTQSQRQPYPQSHYNPQSLTIKKPEREMCGISSSKIKWRDLMKIDLDMIVKTGNFSILEHYLNNILYSDVTEDDIQSVPEGNIVKLIKVFQYTIDHLLTTQQAMEHKCKEYDKQFNEMNMNNYDNDQTMHNNKDLIKNLKKANKENEKLLTTYRTVISCLQTEKHKEAGNDSKIMMMMNNDGNNETKKQFFCQYCTAKKFFTKEELGNHLLKRHLIDTKKSSCDDMTDMMSSLKKSEDDMNKLFDKKLFDLKNYFEDYLNRIKYNESRNDLESRRKAEENKQEKSLIDMENKFKEALNDMKEFALQMNIKKSAIPEVIRLSTVVKSDDKEIISTSKVIQLDEKNIVKQNDSELVENLDEQKEKERLGKELFEKARIEIERLEIERLEREQQEKEQLEKEQLEKEQLEKEQLEKEQLEKEQLEKEQLEKEQQEKEQQEKEEQEKEQLVEGLQEKEQLEKELQARELLLKEQEEQYEKQLLLQEQLEKEQLELIEKELEERAEQEKEQLELIEKELEDRAEQEKEFFQKEQKIKAKDNEEEEYDDNFEINLELEQELNQELKQSNDLNSKNTEEKPHIIDEI